MVSIRVFFVDACVMRLDVDVMLLPTGILNTLENAFISRVH